MRLAGRPRRFWAVAALPILAIFDQRASDEGHFRRPAAASASKKGIFMIIASPHDDQRRSSHGGHFFSCTRDGGVDPACASRQERNLGRRCFVLVRIFFLPLGVRVHVDAGKLVGGVVSAGRSPALASVPPPATINLSTGQLPNQMAPKYSSHRRPKRNDYPFWDVKFDFAALFSPLLGLICICKIRLMNARSRPLIGQTLRQIIGFGV